MSAIKYPASVDTVCYCVVLKLCDGLEGAVVAKRYLIIHTAALGQHRYVERALTSTFK